MLYLRVIAFAAAFTASLALANSPRDRADALKHKLMSPCCWSETLAEHQSPTASELNAQIDQWIVAGVSDEQIEARLTAKYGRRILAEPGGAQGTVLRVVPFAVLAVGAVWVIFLLRRWMRPVPA